jgi:hypothetical protein
MKLKLENQETATILQVTDTIEASHLPILKAGLTKLFQAGKKTIVLDFTAVTEKDFKDPALIQQIADLRSWASPLGGQVAVVSTIARLSHAPSRADALKLFVATAPVAAATPAQAAPIAAAPAAPAAPASFANPAEEEAHLTAQLKQLEAKKSELEKKLGGDAAAADLKKLQQLNSKLKKEIAHAEKIARRYLKLRTKEPIAVGPEKAAQDNLNKLVDSFLTQEGLVK